MLFAKLPENIFKPLSSLNSGIYELTLNALYSLFFDGEGTRAYPERTLVLSEIEEVLSRLSRIDWVREEDDEEEPQSSSLTTAVYANRIFNRLRSTGWLDEETGTFGYEKPRIIMPPAAMDLLYFLVNLASQEKKSYGAAIVGILTNIEAAIKYPRDKASALQIAVENARLFNKHLTSIIYGLRDIQEKIAAHQNPRQILNCFFDEFVSQVLIADYATLMKQNNPFRFRRQILTKLKELQYDREIKDLMAQGYAITLGVVLPVAADRVKIHIQEIINIFESVESRLNTIRNFQMRLDQRVADAVRYMDSSDPTRGQRYKKMLGKLAVIPESVHEMETMISSNLYTNQTISPFSVRAPKRKRIAAEALVFQEQKVRPEVRKRNEEQRKAKQRFHVDPEKVRAYLIKNLAGKDQINATDFKVESIEELVAFTHIRTLSYLGDRGKAYSRKFSIENKDELAEAPWLRFRDFTIRKRE